MFKILLLVSIYLIPQTLHAELYEKFFFKEDPGTLAELLQSTSGASLDPKTLAPKITDNQKWNREKDYIKTTDGTNRTLGSFKDENGTYALDYKANVITSELNLLHMDKEGNFSSYLQCEPTHCHTYTSMECEALSKAMGKDFKELDELAKSCSKLNDVIGKLSGDKAVKQDAEKRARIAYDGISKSEQFKKNANLKDSKIGFSFLTYESLLTAQTAIGLTGVSKAVSVCKKIAESRLIKLDKKVIGSYLYESTVDPCAKVKEDKDYWKCMGKYYSSKNYDSGALIDLPTLSDTPAKKRGR